MLANLDDGGELVLDARAAGRFTGEVPEPRAGMRSGHIPGAANLPYTELLAPDQTLLPPEALRARLARRGGRRRPGGDLLRQRRERLYSHARHGAAGPAGGRCL